MKRAAVYRRVSTPSQVEGFSLDTQLDQLSRLAEAGGYQWEDFCDPGISGEKFEERPALLELLSRLDEFDAVLVVENVVLVVGATGRDHSPAIAHVRPWAQGPPIYLATQRLRN